MHFDTVIVGCGTVGAILAARLSEDASRSVCVIEAGSNYASVDDLPPEVRTHRHLRGVRGSGGRNQNDPERAGFPDWGYKARLTSLQPDVPLPRGKVVGGSSSVNGGVYFRALREDLDAWAAAGNPAWSFDECLPYFNRVEHDFDFEGDHHGASGAIPVHRPRREDWVPINEAFYDACRGLGYPDCPDFNEPDTWGVGPIPVNIHERIRYSSAVGYLMPARGRPNLTVLDNAAVTRLLVAGGAVKGVEVSLDGDPVVVDAGEVVMAAGAVGSPQLLMLSGIGPARHLESVGVAPVIDLVGVGQNLRDHPVLCASWAATDVTLPTSGPGGPGQLGLRGTVPGSDDPYDMRLMSFRAEGPDRFGIPFSLMHARSAGELRLAGADPAAPPLVDFRHLDDPSDLSRMRAMLEVVVGIVEHGAFDELRGDRLVPSDAEYASEAALDEWMLRTAITGHHISGTCKMGPSSDPAAVVDETGRVHGVENLRVADSSIMVDCPRVNINATAMMMAERLSDMIRA